MEKLTAGTQKLVVWVDVSPFHFRGYFQVPFAVRGLGDVIIMDFGVIKSGRG